MIKKEDIKRAVKTFKEWDNSGTWGSPEEIFKQHTLEKSENSLRTVYSGEGIKIIMELFPNQKP